MTVQYSTPGVKDGLRDACVASCTRCGRPYAIGTSDDVQAVMQAMELPDFLREKPDHTHACSSCKDEMIAMFLSRCGDDRARIDQELQLTRAARCNPSERTA